MDTRLDLGLKKIKRKYRPMLMCLIIMKVKKRLGRTNFRNFNIERIKTSGRSF